MIKAGIIGSTGYAGHELVRILANHSYVELAFLSSNSYENQVYSDVYPELKGVSDHVLMHSEKSMEKISDIDVLFTALPHGLSFHYVKKAYESGIKVIDLGADFRLNDKEIFEHWYKTKHLCEDLLESAVYGLPELWKDQIKSSQIVANPGCYTTASILALAPALKYGLIDPFSIIIDAKSGVTGAGRKTDLSLMFAECNESIKAYGIASHRHTPEIEQELSKAYGERLNITFTPHLIPMQRGILATCYGSLPTFCTEDEIYKIYREFYKEAPFIRIRDEYNETRFVKGTNFCDISIRVDIRGKKLIVTSAIDNLVKGAAGQAVQNMNLLFGFEEREGLV